MLSKLSKIIEFLIKTLKSKVENFKKHINAKKNILAEKLCGSISKEKFELSDAIKFELDRRISLVEEDKTEFYTWEDGKNYIRK